MEGLDSAERLKKIVQGIIGNNKKMIMFAFGDQAETALDKIVADIAKEVFAEDGEAVSEIKKAIADMDGVEDLILCVKI